MKSSCIILRFAAAVAFSMLFSSFAVAQTDVSSSASTSNQILVHFKMGYTTFQPYLEENSAAMSDFIGGLKDAYRGGTLDSVEIDAYC